MTAANDPGARWLPVPVPDFQKWQAGLLEESARRLGVVLAPAGQVFRRYSAGSPVRFKLHPAWLRVSPYLAGEMNLNAWNGTAEAAPITRVSKPALLSRIIWHTDVPVPAPVSAEILTLVADPAASSQRLPRALPYLSPEWFSDLRASLAAMRAYPTGRWFPVHNAVDYGYLLSATYRRPVPAGTVPEFGTEHMDLTWDNVTTPSFCILDMEHWGTAVTGYAAAWLYLSALAVPGAAAGIRDALAGVLDTPSGRYAQLVAAALILRNLTHLPDPAGLAPRLHQHTDTLLG
jgi:hypothetical protein